LINTDTTTLAGSYKQEADLDLMSVDWAPVGNEPDYFTGTFDGDGKDIKNLLINMPTQDSVGLFGAVKGTVENVHVRSGSVTGQDRVGGVVGLIGKPNDSGNSESKTVRRCSNAADISGHASVGGVVGNIAIRAGDGADGRGGQIISCYNTGTITGDVYGVGGVVGYLTTADAIACYNTGDVEGLTGVGGVAGINNWAIVIACYNRGSVSGKGGKDADAYIAGVGGVVGCFWIGWGQITACYNTGAVKIKLNGDPKYFGGVLGYSDGSTSIQANYWLDVSGDDVEYGVGSETDTPSNTGATPFSDSDWPTPGTHTQWGIGASDGSGDGTYWKSLGSWNGENSIYPKLWFEDDE
jgi:hypothetical protein